MSRKLEREARERLQELGVDPGNMKFEFSETKNHVRLCSPEYPEVDRLLGAVSGIKIFRKGAVLNPVSNTVFAFGHRAKERIELEKEALIELFSTGRLDFKGERGYRFVAFRGLVVALVFSTGSGLVCMMPSDYRERLLRALKELDV